MKYEYSYIAIIHLLSLPMRERGLKYIFLCTHTGACEVAPHAGAWIEIFHGVAPSHPLLVAPHAGAWIEMLSIGVVGTL